MSAARGKLGAASRALQGFAVSEYVNSGLYSGAPLVSNADESPQPLTSHTPLNADGVVEQQYLGVAANNLINNDDAAAGAFKGSKQHRSDAAKALGQASLTLTSDEEAENRDLAELIKDVATLEHAGACASVTITPPPTSTTVAAGSATTTTTAAPTTTTTTSSRPRPPRFRRRPPRRRSRSPPGRDRPGRADDDHHDGPADHDHHHGSADDHHDSDHSRRRRFRQRRTPRPRKQPAWLNCRVASQPSLLRQRLKAASEGKASSGPLRSRSRR